MPSLALSRWSGLTPSTIGGDPLRTGFFRSHPESSRSDRSPAATIQGYTEVIPSRDGRRTGSPTPLSDLCLVFTECRSLVDDPTDAVLERGLTPEVTRLLAF
jgi:hypothetical protein